MGPRGRRQISETLRYGAMAKLQQHKFEHATMRIGIQMRYPNEYTSITHTHTYMHTHVYVCMYACAGVEEHDRGIEYIYS